MTRMSFVNACGKRFFQACEAAGILYNGAGMRMVGLLLRLREGPLPRKIDGNGLTGATASGLGQAVTLGWASYDRTTDSYLFTAAGQVRLDELRAANLIELAERLTKEIDNYQP
jgi:hypothetical protein